MQIVVAEHMTKFHHGHRYTYAICLVDTIASTELHLFPLKAIWRFSKKPAYCITMDFWWFL
jgi:hypothetical protein